jgi:hypothetical protein
VCWDVSAAGVHASFLFDVFEIFALAEHQIIQKRGLIYPRPRSNLLNWLRFSHVTALQGIAPAY